MIDQTVQTEQERTFHFFSRLPAELRWKIWEHSLPGPRLVSIRCGSDDLGSPSAIETSYPYVPGCSHLCSSSFSSFSRSSAAGCTSPARIPANLHASHESRREALRHYHAAFGIARHPGQIFFSASSDILYFGPRDGFMASEAQLRTVLTLCDPAELAHVQKVAVNDAVFCAPAAGDTKVAISLLVDVVQLLHTRLPGLRELVFVPRDENPLYSADACLVEPAMAQSRLSRIMKEAMAVVFGDQPPSERPWNWRIMTLSADADVPLYSREVLGWDAVGKEEEVEYGNVYGPGYAGPGWIGEKHGAGKSTGRNLTRSSLLQESVKGEFMHMGVGAHVVVPAAVEWLR